MFHNVAWYFLGVGVGGLFGFFCGGYYAYTDCLRQAQKALENLERVAE